MADNIRFRFDYKKCIEAIQFIASKQPGITQYYVGKVFFFADKEHLLDWGRSISGDRYVAMEHGPVPSNVRDIIKLDSDEPDEIVDFYRTRISSKKSGNKIHLYENSDSPKFSRLSDSDMEYLLNAIEKYGKMSFAKIKELSHLDASYEDAWSKSGLNNEMNIGLWLSEDQRSSLDESSVIQRRRYA